MNDKDIVIRQEQDPIMGMVWHAYYTDGAMLGMGATEPGPLEARVRRFRTVRKFIYQHEDGTLIKMPT